MKISKRFLATVVALLLVSLSVTGVLADTIYNYYGFEYTIINNSSVSLCGWDNSSSQLNVPDTLNNRYVVEISNRAFIGNTEITGAVLYNAPHLRRIGKFAFKDCVNLSGAISLPENVSVIDTAAFEGCSALQTAKLAVSAAEIPSQCFNQCESLNSVTLNDNIRVINSYAFTGCKSLTYIEIPTSVEQISGFAFDKDIVTLGVYTDSYAHQYAVQKSISFILLDAPSEPPTESATEPATDALTEPVTEAPTASPATPDEPTIAPTEPETLAPTEPVTEAPTLPLTYLLGDANGNGEVETNDATIIQRYLIALPVSVSYDILMQGNVDRDAELTIVDATFIQRYDIGLRTPHPIGQYVNR